MFVGDINNGLLYRFDLNDARNDMSFKNGYSGDLKSLQDKEINDPKENHPIVFGQGFGGITDLQVGPDGYLYVLSYTGSLFKILPGSLDSSDATAAHLNNDTNDNTSNLDTSSQVDSSNGDSIKAVILGINDDNSYSPNPITIKKGQTITWYNGDTISHTVTSATGNNANQNELFDSGAIIPNQHSSITFDTRGDFEYYCIYHPSMIGEIKVK